MRITTNVDHSQPKQITNGLSFLGCLGLLSIPFVCGIGFSLFTLVTLGLDRVSLSPMRTNAEGILFAPATLVVVFVILTVVAHSLVLPELPQKARRWWILATLIGASIYWAVFRCLIAAPPEPLIRLFDGLASAAGPVSATVGWVWAGAGIILGSIAGAGLGGNQWLVLRRLSPTAWRWPAALISVSAIVGGFVLAVVGWMSNWTWMGT